MIPTSAIAFFCEDIRAEAESRVTVIGIFPDNMNLEIPSGTLPEGKVPALPKLSIFVRISFDPNKKLDSIKAKVINPDGTETALDGVAADVIQKAQKEAREQNNINSNINMTLQMQPFPVPTFGRMRLEVEVGGETFVCGALNFQKAPAKT